MPRLETEWDLQTHLTRQWVKDGVATPLGRLFVLAWEVMLPSWDTNDPRTRWNEPSIDFVLLDKHGALIALELKRTVISPRSSWAVLAQVTHRAVRMYETATWPHVQNAFQNSYGTQADKHPDGFGKKHDLLARHQHFYGLDAPLARGNLGRGRVTRAVGAIAFGRSWSTCRETFETQREDDVLEALARRYKVASKGNLEFRRLIEVNRWKNAVTPAILAVEVQPHPESAPGAFEPEPSRAER